MEYDNSKRLIIRAENELNVIASCEKALDVFKKKPKDYPAETPLSVTLRKTLISKKLYQKNVNREKHYAAITRWLFTQKLYDLSNSDPILSTTDISDIGFAIYMKDRKLAEQIERKMKTERDEVREIIAESKNNDYRLEVVHNTSGITFYLNTAQGLHVETISMVQLEKLRKLYNENLGEKKKDFQEFYEHVYMCVTTYNTLLSEGYQGALPPKVFLTLQTYLEVNTELFASPLNVTLLHYLSAFPSIDGCFGSNGSFFDHHDEIFAKGGSFECNPPFTEEHIYCAAKIIDSAFTKYTNPLSVVLVLPAWEDSAGFRILFESKHKRLFLSLRRFMHFFITKGAKHPISDRLSQAHSHLLVLQNAAGAEKWPVTKDFVRDVLQAFRE